MAKKWRDLYSRIPAERRKGIEAEMSAMLADLPLDELRRARKLSQEQLAEALGAKQSSISKLEQQTDMYVSTLRRYLEAMGGELVIAVRFPAGAIQISHFAEIEGREAFTSKGSTVRDGSSHPKSIAVSSATGPTKNIHRTIGRHMSNNTKSTRNSGKEWKSSDVKQLKQLANENTPTRVIGLKLGRTPAAVQARASDEKISLKPTNQSPYGGKKKK
jgi:transcriptional regulator with XRE-family HTH domain